MMWGKNSYKQEKNSLLWWSLLWC